MQRNGEGEPHLRAARRASDERRALRQDERRESIFFLKGWKDEASGETAGDAADPVHAAVTALRPKASRQTAEEIRDAGFRERAADAMAEGRPDALSSVADTAEEDGPARDAALPAKARLTAQSLDAAAQQAPDRPDFMPPAFSAREGVPYAIVNYLPSPDFLDMAEAEEARHDDEGGHAAGDGEGDANGEERAEDDNGDAPAGGDARETEPVVEDFVEDDPAYGYYQRMAGII